MSPDSCIQVHQFELFDEAEEACEEFFDTKLKEWYFDQIRNSADRREKFQTRKETRVDFDTGSLKRKSIAQKTASSSSLHYIPGRSSTSKKTSTRTFNVTGFTLLIAMVYADEFEASAQVSGIAATNVTQPFVSRFVLQTDAKLCAWKVNVDRLIA
ncbi:hypothetical protein KIN20_027666 [Parelaphostrongylus tenuis]|uniref:Uncharacterized protein n=1 Tax=Parelaphostrongylus tenuis TaxID=148309 RepID=A0AAD5R0C6_PARTN|nr:hypothetical protein KIN20_027666 [Parelaphostrongylus tenuis]